MTNAYSYIHKFMNHGHVTLGCHPHRNFHVYDSSSLSNTENKTNQISTIETLFKSKTYNHQN